MWIKLIQACTLTSQINNIYFKNSLIFILVNNMRDTCDEIFGNNIDS